METCTDRAAVPKTRGEARRGLLVGAIHGLWVIITATLGATASTYLLREPKVRGGDEWIDIGEITGLPSGQPVEMVFHRNHADGWKVTGEKLSAWVVKTADNGVIAFGPRCTHLGCAHHWDQAKKQFACPCHNSLFSIEGKVCAGPAPRPLDRYDVKLDGPKLLLGQLRHSPEDVA